MCTHDGHGQLGSPPCKTLEERAAFQAPFYNICMKLASMLW